MRYITLVSSNKKTLKSLHLYTDYTLYYDENEDWDFSKDYVKANYHYSIDIESVKSIQVFKVDQNSYDLYLELQYLPDRFYTEKTEM